MYTNIEKLKIEHKKSEESLTIENYGYSDWDIISFPTNSNDIQPIYVCESKRIILMINGQIY